MKTAAAVFLFTTFWCVNVLADTQTLYFRSDTHTVNGLAANKLQSANSSTDDSISTTGSNDLGSCASETFSFDVYIRHAGGSETTLGTGVAGNSESGNTSGETSVTWAAPETNLISTDAIKVVARISESVTGQQPTRTFVTSELGWTKINAATWTFSRNWQSQCFENCNEEGCTYNSIGTLRWGSASNDTRIDGVSFTTGGSRRIVSVS